MGIVSETMPNETGGGIAILFFSSAYVSGPPCLLTWLYFIM